MKKPNEDKCDDCKKRRDDGYAFCDKCMNKLWETPFIRSKTVGTGGNSHQGLH